MKKATAKAASRASTPAITMPAAPANVHELAMIPYRDLVAAPDNIRRTPATKEEQAELKASIAALGVLVPLVVKEDPKKPGRFLVHDGGRRLAAIGENVADKTFSPVYPVPCSKLAADADPLEACLTINLQRASMHPIDEYEAFTALHKTNNLSVDDIAARFGRKKLDVQKRLALGGAHPDLRTLCRQGKLSVDSLAVYAGTPDLDRQMKIYKALKRKGDQNYPHNIRRMLNESCYPSTHRLVKFIGLDAYKKEGGQVAEDFFDETVRLVDTDLVDRLAQQKLQHAAEKAGQGWKWFEVDHEYNWYSTKYGHIQPTKGKFTKDQMANAGVVVKLDHSGKVEVFRGVVKKEDMAAAKKAAKKKKTAKKGVGAALDAALSEDSLSNALQQDLRWYQLSAAKAALASLLTPMLMVDALLFSVCRLAFGEESWENRSDFLHMSFDGEPEIQSATCNIENGKAHQLVVAARSRLNLQWAELEEVHASFAAFQALPIAEKFNQVAYAATLALKRPDNALLDELLRQADTNLAHYWRPTAENFFSRLNQPQRLDVAAKICAPGEIPPEVHRMKSGPLSLWLENKVANASADTCWMPPGFAIPPAPAPAPPNASKAKAAKKVKRSAAATASIGAEDDGDDD